MRAIAAVVPGDLAEFAMEGVDGAFAFDGEQLVDLLLDRGDCALHFRQRLVHLGEGVGRSE